MDKQALEKVFKRIEGFKDDMVQLQKDIVPIKAISPESGGTGELKKSQFLEKLLKTFCDEVNVYNAPFPTADGGVRPNIVARVKGKSSSKTIWFMAHMDVVPEGDLKLWNTDPWTAVVKDGKIYGRGTEDNNQAIVTSVYAMKAVLDEGMKPNYDVGLLFVADEENGSKHGVYWLLNNHDVVKKNDLVIVPDAGDPKGEQIEVAEKGTLWIKVTTKGTQAHASKPHTGKNTHRANAYLIVKVDGLRSKYSEKNPLFDYEYTSFEPTKKENNVPNVNTIPGEDVIYFDCRRLPTVSKEEFLGDFTNCCKEIEKQFDVTISLEFPNDIQPSATDVNSPVVKAMIMAASEVRGVKAKAVGIGGGTVAAQFRHKGIPAVDHSQLDETLHGPNEYCVIDYMVNDAKVWAHLMLQD